MTESLPWLEGASPGIMALGALCLAGLVFAIVVARIYLRARRETIELKTDTGKALVDLEFIDQLAAAAPADRVTELFTAMAQDCRACIDDIRGAAKLSDFDRVQEECASLADSCEAFGAKGLAGHARRLKTAVQDHDFNSAGRLIVEIDGVADQTFRAINYRIKRSSRGRARALR